MPSGTLEAAEPEKKLTITCMAEPTAPDPAKADDGAIVAFIKGLLLSGEDCRIKLKQVQQ